MTWEKLRRLDIFPGRGKIHLNGKREDEKEKRRDQRQFFKSGILNP